MSPAALLVIGLGGFLGAVARHVVGQLVTRWLGAGWPWGTFLVNLSGSFALGFFVTLTTARLPVHHHWRLLFAVGFVGAYTTFSTYQYETLRLIETGAWGRALGYVVGSTVGGFLAVWLAVKLAR